LVKKGKKKRVRKAKEAKKPLMDNSGRGKKGGWLTLKSSWWKRLRGKWVKTSTCERYGKREGEKGVRMCDLSRGSKGGSKAIWARDSSKEKDREISPREKDRGGARPERTPTVKKKKNKGKKWTKLYRGKGTGVHVNKTVFEMASPGAGSERNEGKNLVTQ